MPENEKYKGDALLQKSYTVDFLTKKKKRNDGEIPQYYVEGNHEAIIAPDVFERFSVSLSGAAKAETGTAASTFSPGKSRCGQCGSWYGSKVWHSTDKYRQVIWQCNHKFDNDERCATPHLTDDEIKAFFISAVNKLLPEKDRHHQSLRYHKIDGFRHQ
jgi:site-specific DNA recombinase